MQYLAAPGTDARRTVRAGSSCLCMCARKSLIGRNYTVYTVDSKLGRDSTVISRIRGGVVAACATPAPVPEPRHMSLSTLVMCHTHVAPSAHMATPTHNSVAKANAESAPINQLPPLELLKATTDAAPSGPRPESRRVNPTRGVCRVSNHDRSLNCSVQGAGIHLHV